MFVDARLSINCIREKGGRFRHIDNRNIVGFQK